MPSGGPSTVDGVNGSSAATLLEQQPVKEQPAPLLSSPARTKLEEENSLAAQIGPRSPEHLPKGASAWVDSAGPHQAGDVWDLSLIPSESQTTGQPALSSGAQCQAVSERPAGQGLTGPMASIALGLQGKGRKSRTIITHKCGPKPKSFSLINSWSSIVTKRKHEGSEDGTEGTGERGSFKVWKCPQSCDIFL